MLFKKDNTTRNKLYVVAIIPARGGSKGIPRKNLRKLVDKPLIAYTIEAAKESKLIDRIIVSTDDEQIREMSKLYGAEVPFLRPRKLARDDTPMLPVVQHAVRFLERNGEKIGAVVLLQPTSPLRTKDEIDEAIRKLLKTTADSVISVCETKAHQKLFTLDKDKLICYSGDETVTSRQKLPKMYALNGAIYVVKRDVLMKGNTLYGKDVRAIVMTEERSVDIDTPFDFFIAESILTSWDRGYAEESNDRK